MKKINFKKPQYILPIVFLPFLCLFFYVYSNNTKDEVVEQEVSGLQSSLPEVSENVKENGISNKLDAYRNRYKNADGLTAMQEVEPDMSEVKLDSIDEQYRQMYNKADSRHAPDIASNNTKQNSSSSIVQSDKELAQALNALAESSSTSDSQLSDLSYASTEANQSEAEGDPMDLFRKQMEYVDSLGKASDPEYQAEQKRLKAQQEIEEELKNQPRMAVDKANASHQVFNTVKREESKSFIKAIIDENVQGYAGSRIRLRLLEDISVGGNLIKEGTYLYAQITSFSEQRVGLTVSSIIRENDIYPVTLEVYDLDGMQGLYVPASQFREFSKQLGNQSMQGINISSDPQNTSQFIMSSMQRMFSSTSSAIANLIRKNKAKLKYNTFIYLIDPQELQTQQQNLIR